MTKSIVVGVDPFHDNPGPLELAGLLARATGATVVAVAAHPHESHATQSASPAFERAVADAAEAALRDVPAALDGVAVTTLAIPASSPARALYDVAQEHDGGIIVVGSKHGGAIGRLLPGGVTDQVLNGAACPVAVAPHGFRFGGPAPRRVGVAFVDTPEGRDALRGGLALASRCDASVRAITLVEPIIVAPAAGMSGAAWAEVPLDEARSSQRAAVAAVAGDVPVVCEVIDGRSSTLAEASAGFDVLVCGSRGYGPVKTVLLGSVSHRLARTARCPLIVLPRGSEGTLEALLEAAATASNAAGG